MGKKSNKEQPEAGCELAEEQPAEELAGADCEEQAGLEEQLRFELQQASEQSKNNYDLYLRTLAEMDNLRKRTQREKEELAKFANENILRELLSVIDNLERAVEHAEKAEMGENGAGLLEGVQMTLTEFSRVLGRFGVEAIDACGTPFDPNLHQAVGQLETAEIPVNCVAQQLQKGYLLNQRLLRPAMVMVAKAPAETVANDSSTTDDQQ